MSQTDFINSIASDIRYAPAIIAAFVFVLLLLFIKELPQPIQQWFIPSIAIYIMASGIIGYIQAILYARKGEVLATWQTVSIIIAHIVLLLFLVSYNCFRGTL